jgi:potassium efflux system protein
VGLKSTIVKRALLLCLLILAIPVAGQEPQELTQALIEQRIATLRAANTADDDETLKTYQTAQSWLTRAANHASDAAQYVAQLTDAPQREASIQARLDAIESEDTKADMAETLSGEKLSTELILVQSQLRDDNEKLDVLERRLTARETNAGVARDRAAEIATRLGKMSDQAANVDPAAAPSLKEAKQWLELAELTALRNERRALSAQLDSQPGRYSAWRAERAELQFDIQRLKQRDERLSAQLLSAQHTSLSIVPLGIEADSPIYGLGVRYQAENLALTTQQLALESQLAQVKAEQEKLKRATRILNERFARARRVVDFATQSDAIGKALIAYWQEIDKLELKDRRKDIPGKIGDNVISRIDHEENLARLVNASVYLDSAIIDAGLNPDEVTRPQRETMLELVRARRDLLRSIIAAESGFIDTLSELEADYTQHFNSSAEYKNYLEPLVLWIPSGSSLWKVNLNGIAGQIPALASAIGHIEVSLQPVFFVSIILALSLLLLSGRLRDYQHAQNKSISRVRDDSIYFTLIALAISALRSAPIALLVVASASLFSAGTDAAAVALTAVLDILVTVLFSMTFLNMLCGKSGVARLHFAWDTQLCDRLQLETRWFIRSLLPALTVAGFLYRLDDIAPFPGRLAMLAVALWLSLHFARYSRIAAKGSKTPELSTTENRARLILALVFMALVVGVILGLRYSVSVVTITLMDMLTAGIALTVVHSLLLRWLHVVRRHLRFRELLAARQERAEPHTSEIGTVEEEQANLAEIGDESLQLLNATTIVVALSILYYLWAPILPVFSAMSGIILWTSTSMIEGAAIVDRITMDTVVFVFLLASITVYASRKLPALVELILRSRTDVSPGTRYATSTLLNYVILGTGILVALSTLGLDWSKLQWLVAALGVGIGFGLQEIVANFISGLIILFERPISVGDIITVGDQDGIVTKIRIRATTIRDWDNKELLIPNKEIITGRLLNWSLTDTRLRLSVPVGVAYGSDVVLALKILRETVADDERILTDPESSIIFSGFGESSLDMVCRFYIDNIDNLWPVKTNLHLEIYRRFEEAGIVISFPQRDVHLASEKPLRITMDPPPLAE